MTQFLIIIWHKIRCANFSLEYDLRTWSIFIARLRLRLQHQRLCLRQRFGKRLRHRLRHHRLRIHQNIGKGFDIIDYAFANTSPRGFANYFGVIDYTFIKILARGFNFTFIVNLEFGVTVGIFLTSPSPTIWSGASPSTSSILPSLTIWSGGSPLASLTCLHHQLEWGITIYDSCDNNRTYVVYFKHANKQAPAKRGWRGAYRTSNPPEDTRLAWR